MDVSKISDALADLKSLLAEANKDKTAMVIDFLKKNPNPKDDAVHAWAEKEGLDIHDLEAIFYRLATKYVNSTSAKIESMDEGTAGEFKSSLASLLKQVAGLDGLPAGLKADVEKLTSKVASIPGGHPNCLA